ncbi:MAG: sulfatase [Bryobacteraceae bacterium]|nr:sulfatase [Bryobacteraceae bacterium]
MISRRSFLAATAASTVLRAAPDKKLNVLFLAVDDMRPDLGAYGNKYVKTPNLDKLASRGLTFLRAYCQQAVCSPSRTSLLTGRRPDTTKVYELQTHFRKTIPNVVTLPEHFKKNGYVSTGMGKIFHGGLDDPQSWSIPWWGPGMPAKWNTEENKARSEKVWARLQESGLKIGAAGGTRAQRGPAWVASELSDKELPDGKTADMAIEALSTLKDKPFFLAVGFVKPHLPFVAPKKYYDLYPKESVKHTDYAPEPKGMPALAAHTNGELRSYSDIPEQGPIPEEKALELIRGYYAALSFTDAQIGRVVDHLDKLGLRDNTVVIVWGDHGWHLGNHGLWHKHTNFERATHAPLIVSVPGTRGGRKSNALVEFVDIYPSLAEICGLPKPEGVEGASFKPLLDRPNRDWKAAAFSQYPRGKAMGYSMRTDRYRYTEWITPGSTDTPAELYDYQTDPDESQNLAVLPQHAPLIKELSQKLKAGWKAALPST